MANLSYFDIFICGNVEMRKSGFGEFEENLNNPLQTLFFIQMFLTMMMLL